MLINHPDRVLGDPNALYCKSQGGGTSATLDQWRSQLLHGLEPVCLCAPPACHALTPPKYSLIAIRKFQRLAWVRPSNAHNVYVEPVSHQRAASFLCTAYSLTAIRKFQRLTWVRPSNAHN